MKVIYFNCYQMLCLAVLLEPSLCVFFDWVINFYDVRDHEVCDNQDCKHPKTYKENPRIDISRNLGVHVTCDKPIVHYHYVKQCEHWSTKIVEVHQVVQVEDWSIILLGLLNSVWLDQATPEKLSNEGISVEKRKKICGYSQEG